MSTATVAASYRGLFAKPVLRRLAVADACARLPQGMVSLTVLLVAAEHASMTTAGLAVAGYTLGQAVTGPVRGRLADRRGLIPVAVACGTCYALALLALLGAAGLYPPLLGVAAPLAGLCLGSTLATLFSRAANAAPRGGGTETQAWLNSIMNAGAAGGAALAGFAAGRPVLALALGAGTAAAAAASAVRDSKEVMR
jgi:MFS family permease